MIGIEVNNGEVELQAKRIEQLMTDNPDMRERIKDIIREDMWKARAAVVRNTASIFDNGDPAESRRAIRNIVYESILGGNLNIRNMKQGTAGWKVKQVVRTGDPTKPGGNRRHRSYKTIRMHGYEGKARGMILRWLNDGVNDRSINFTTNPSRKVDKWNKHPNTGNRGSITPRNFFQPTAEAALSVIAQHIAQMIENEMQNMNNNNP